MDDVDYARELYAILTATPDPEVPVGRLGDDGIDRGDGFGTEVRVTGIEVVPGDHGNQLDIAFVLDVPDDVDVPSEGSLRLPLDAEWREISGYAEPEDYAPRVAARLVHNVHDHVRSHQASRDDDRVMPSRAEQHALLMEVLGGQGHVEEQAADRYLVRRPRWRHDLTVLLTADQWERVLRKHGARRAWLLEHFDELFASTPGEECFLVFWEGDATTSTWARLPPAKRPFPPCARCGSSGRRLGGATAPSGGTPTPPDPATERRRGTSVAAWLSSPGSRPTGQRGCGATG